MPARRPPPPAPAAPPAPSASRRVLMGPFNRVEGDLEVHLDVRDGAVATAHVNAPMYRGFEQILRGKHPHDALVFVPRICGICSVSQSVAAARALADLAGVQPPPNGQRATNLMLAVENMADHLTHFHVFFMADFCRADYAQRPWFAEVQRQWQPEQGEQVRAALAARQRWFTLMGTLGGRWPHTQSLEPGGTSRAIDAGERIRLLARVREFRAYLEDRLFAAPLEAINALHDEDALWTWHASAPAHHGGALRLFLTVAHDTGLHRLGAGPGRYLSFGAYPGADGTPALGRGLWDAATRQAQPLDASAIAEDATHAWLADGPGALHPWQGQTDPQPDKPDAYTWNKAPRLGGQVVETGAIARQLLSGHPLVLDAVARHGGTVYTRVLARLLELARVVPLMEQWLAELRPDEPFCHPAPLPDEGQGAGLSEAARGALGHWLTVHQGKLANYQIVAPTSWNFSPRDAGGTPGALEQALQGLPVADGDRNPVAVQHVVRSFDPCMVCTVH